MICLGAGLAAGSALSHPLERLDVVDLLQAVRHGAAHFADENNHVLEDPRLVLHVNDGRQYLLTTRRRFDLAIVDSTHPKSVDSWILYTREFFQLLRSRLNPDGIAVQWLPLHGLSEREFVAVVATFASVFPRMTLWASVGYETYGQVGYAKLVGQHSDAPMRFDVGRMQTRLEIPEVQRDLVRYGMGRLGEVLDQFVAGPERVRDYVGTSPILSDDRPFLAYLTDLSAGRPMTPDRLLAVRESVRPYLTHTESFSEREWSELERNFDAQGLVVAGQLDAAVSLYPTGDKIRSYIEQTKTTLPYYSTLARIYRDDTERLFEAGTQLGALGHGDIARDTLRAGLLRSPRSLRLALNAGLLELGVGRAREAAAIFSTLKALHPNSRLLDQNLGAALLAQGEPGAARRVLLNAVAGDPRSIGAQMALIDAEMTLRDWPSAKRRLELLVHDEPLLDTAIIRLARVEEHLGNSTAADELFARAESLNPYREEYLIEQARRLQDARPKEALDVLRRAARLFPDSAPTKVAQGGAHLRLEQWQEASQYFVAALELSPRDTVAALGLGQALASLQRKQEARDAFCLASKLGATRLRIARELAAIGEKIERCGTISALP
jgi:tetratricopeptide (TPR) repeat protein